jgi:uncharacterized phage-associated protein
MDYPFQFNLDKGLETVLYIIQNGTQPTFHHISKVIYFADKIHLEKYGRFICGDRYVAMKHGPVPGGVYDLLKIARGDRFIFSLPSELIEKTKRAFNVQGRYGVNRVRDAHIEYFSDSDTECLNIAIQKYGNLSFRQLTDVSHDQAWEISDENDFMEIEHIVATFRDENELLEHLRDQFPGSVV